MSYQSQQNVTSYTSGWLYHMHLVPKPEKHVTTSASNTSAGTGWWIIVLYISKQSPKHPVNVQLMYGVFTVSAKRHQDSSQQTS